MHKLLPLVLVAHVALAATPRAFVADKVGDARDKLKSAEKKIDDLPAVLKDASKLIADIREKLKAIGPQVVTAQTNLDTAQAHLKSAIATNTAMGEALKALPAPTPGRDALLKQNADLLTQLQAAETSLKTARTSLADAPQQLADADAKLKLVADKLDGAKELPSTAQLNDVIDMLDAVLKVNKAAMPDFPNIKELK